VANAGPGYTIPANTPFVLTGSGTDVNTGDVLTYAWDEMDLGKASTATDMADEGTRPLFRSFVPSSSPARYFPKLDSLRNNVSDIGERLPTTNRQLKFRLTVRDQRGGVADSDVALTVTNSAGPFQVIAPNGGESLQTSTTATWNVANTNLAPVSCPSVGITLSTDSGASFPVSLLASTPNTGSATVTFPAGTSSTARLKIQCTNNIFFDISNNNFSYNSVGSSCRYALGASSASAAAGGLSGSVSVTTTTGCAWTASSNASWISISSGASGTGSGSVGYVVAANTGATTRSGTLTIAGQTFTVNQAAASVSAAVVQFAPTTYSVAESAGSVTLTVSRTGDTSGTATVAYSTCGAGCATLATATPGSDYTAASGTLSFGPGVSSQTISVPILNDNLVEGSETFTVTLSSPTGASLGAANAATVTILDGQTSQLILAGRLFNLPSPDNSDSGILRIYNGGSLPGLVTGTLYDQNGNVLGTADLTLTTSLAAKGALVLASSDLAARLGVNTWAGRAWIEIKSTLPAGTLLLQNLVRSTTLTNMSCVSDSVALNIPAVGNTDQAFIRLYNVGSTAGAIRGTLYDQSGSVLGNANSTLVSSLAGKAVTVLTADVIQSATGAPTWTGRAWLSMTADFGSNLKIMNLIRDSSNTLNNMSCVF
jgi:hypothetical protein